MFNLIIDSLFVIILIIFLLESFFNIFIKKLFDLIMITYIAFRWNLFNLGSLFQLLLNIILLNQYIRRFNSCFWSFILIQRTLFKSLIWLQRMVWIYWVIFSLFSTIYLLFSLCQRFLFLVGWLYIWFQWFHSNLDLVV